MLRRKVVRHKYIHDDYPIPPTFNVDLRITGNGYNGYGFDLGVTRSRQEDGAYHIEPVINSEKNIEK